MSHLSFEIERTYPPSLYRRLGDVGDVVTVESKDFLDADGNPIVGQWELRNLWAIGANAYMFLSRRRGHLLTGKEIDSALYYLRDCIVRTDKDADLTFSFLQRAVGEVLFEHQPPDDLRWLAVQDLYLLLSLLLIDYTIVCVQQGDAETAIETAVEATQCMYEMIRVEEPKLNTLEFRSEDGKKGAKVRWRHLAQTKEQALKLLRSQRWKNRTAWYKAVLDELPDLDQKTPKKWLEEWEAKGESMPFEKQYAPRQPRRQKAAVQPKYKIVR